MVRNVITHYQIPMHSITTAAYLPYDDASALLVDCVWRSADVNGISIVVRGRQVYDISDSALNIDVDTILLTRGASPGGWPGSAEVVSMQPPDVLIKRGTHKPESAAGGSLAWFRTGAPESIDLNTANSKMLVDEEKPARRQQQGVPPYRPARRTGRKSTAPPSGRGAEYAAPQSLNRR